MVGKSRENEEQLFSFFPQPMHLLSNVRVILLSGLGVKDLLKCSCVLQRLWAWCFQCAGMWSVAFLLLLDWQELDSILASSPPLEPFWNVSFGQLCYNEDSLNPRIFLDIRHM